MYLRLVGTAVCHKVVDRWRRVDNCGSEKRWRNCWTCAFFFSNNMVVKARWRMMKYSSAWKFHARLRSLDLLLWFRTVKRNVFAIHDCLWCICTSFAVNFFTTSEINGSLKSSPSNNSSLYNKFLCLSTSVWKKWMFSSFKSKLAHEMNNFL